MTEHEQIGSTEQPTLLLCSDDGFFDVWLNPDAMPLTGLCIGQGPTREVALRAALETLKAACRDLDAALDPALDPQTLADRWG